MAEIKTYTLQELTQILKLTRRTLYRYIQAGTLPAVKVGREWRISEEALKDMLTPKKDD